MKSPRNRRAAIISLAAVGLACLISAALLLAPNQITTAEPLTCVDRYLGDKYLTVDSCDSVFADYAVITTQPVSASMKDSRNWQQRHCEANVDGWSTYTVFEVDGEEHIACLGKANH